MKIAIVSDAIYPYNNGGKEMRIYELSTRLAKAGHDVHIYTMKWWEGPSKRRTEKGVQLHAISRKWSLYHGERRSILQGVLFGIACWRLLDEQFDVVDVDHMPYFPLFSMRMVTWILRKPMVATWHEVWGFKYWMKYLGMGGLIAATLERLSVMLPDHIVAVSPHTAERLSTVLRARQSITRVSNGIDMGAISALAPSDEASDIVYIGRLLTHKNVDKLIGAVAILAKSRPNVRCIIISDGPERANLERLARELGVEKNVIFKGFVKSDSEKLRLLKSSRVFVLPSTREGFGIVALEAMACGLPVVTVDHPDNATKDLITPATGRLCAPTADGLAVAISELFAEEAGQAPEDMAGSFDWSHSAQAVAKVYAR